MNIDLRCKDKKCPVCEAKINSAKNRYSIQFYCNNGCYDYLQEKHSGGFITYQHKLFDKIWYCDTSDSYEQRELIYNIVIKNIKKLRENDNYLLEIITMSY